MKLSMGSGKWKKGRRIIWALKVVKAGKFPLGRTVTTRGVAEEIKENNQFGRFVQDSIGRHSRGDWGDVSSGDKKENELSLKNKYRILSSYSKSGMPKIWVITEADRSSTTVLFPSEY